MYANLNKSTVLHDVFISPDVLDYIAKRDCDFRICTSCGGPVLLPIHLKPPKNTDLLLKAGNHTIYISVHQARYLHAIMSDMIPFIDDPDLFRHEDK